MALMPKESAKLIARLSKNVFIEEEGVKNLACAILEGLKNQKINMNNFSQCEWHPSMDDPRAVDWIFVLDTLNYSFWSKKDSPKDWWTVNGQSGYFALCAAIKRAIDEGKPIIDPKYYSHITRSDAEHIFRGDNQTTIPLLDERLKSLRDAGKILLGKYQGTFVECIKSCSHSAEQLLKLVVNEFESYQDEADYEGHRVSFYKRAQILIGDIWACFKGKGLGEFYDIDYVTMFADYRIPQVLVHFGAIRYSNPLMSRLQNDVELENGGDDEIEIRGCSIEAVERVRDEIRALIERYPNLELKKSDINAILIDHFLWDYRREHATELEHIPFHKTRCIYY
ncbi:queuosine 5'-phosphate N-glycosylase/hydrolase [Nomia melanderi]|uniref:queuosine 5'-phosphate N-glycosylase/hydrolase n=1 Tax=Nomia melanderi TaxID=2448451 RepID=UPI00130460CD|nr:queuosine salvage protein [Nomia melanderi]